MRRCFTVLAVALAGLVVAGGAQAQTTLRYKFKEGEKLNYVIDQDQKMSMSIGGMDIETKVLMVMDMTWDVQKIDEQGNAHVKIKMDRVKMTMDGPTGKVEIDSKDAKEPDDPIGQILGQVVQAMAGMEMSTTVSPTGEMKDTKIPEETIKKLKNLPGVDKLGGDLFSPDNMKGMMQGGMVLPKDAVTQGKSWTEKLNQKMPFGKITGETKYTYEGTVDKGGKQLAKISVQPDLKIDADPNAPLQIKIKGGKGKGYTYFDNQAGRIVESNNETTMEMEIEIGGMTINQRIMQNTTLKLKGQGGDKGSERPR
jgi:hypothetical protein